MFYARLVFNRFFDFRRNLGNVKEKGFYLSSRLLTEEIGLF